METSALRSRAIRALLAAEVISTTGMQMTWVALPWFVLTATGSATRMSVVMAAEAIGLAVVGFPSGKLLDRLGARRTMLLCDALRGPLMLAVPILHWADALSFWVLVSVAFVLGAFGAPYFAANRLILPELLGEDEGVVSQASALFQGATRTTLLLGPVAAGVLIGVIGAPAVLVVDAATYVVAVVLVALFVPATKPAAVDEGVDRGVIAGLRWIAQEPLLRVWRLAMITGDIAWQAIFVALPVLVVARYDSDPKIVGILFAAFGVGAVLGNVFAYRLVKRIDGLTLIAKVALGQALPLWLLVVELPVWGAFAALFASGVANGLINPSLHAIVTLRIPAALRPTVMTGLMTLYSLAMPIGILGAGPLLDAFGVDPVFALCAAIQTAMMAAVALAAVRARSAAGPDPHGPSRRRLVRDEQKPPAGMREADRRAQAARAGSRERDFEKGLAESASPRADGGETQAVASRHGGPGSVELD
jgi:MFS family permease